MQRILLALAASLHVRLLIAACMGGTSELESAACENVASQGTSERQSSLLQTVKQTQRTPLDLTEQKAKRVVKLDLSDVFLYDHLPKAGGSFIRGVLAGPTSKVISPDHVRIIEEGQTLTEEDRQHTFTVGSIRNPCNYYVSCWAFSGRLEPEVQKIGGFAQEEGEDFYGTSDELNTPEDKQRFGRWLRHVMPGGSAPGLLTTRMLWSYANESVGDASRPEPNLVGWPVKDRLTYRAAALAFDPSSVDCWIRTETLKDDLRSCLMRFEDRAGPDVVNWAEFNKTLKAQEKEHKETSEPGNFSFKVWTKNSEHQPCDFYFDQANTDFVLKTDSEIFSKFGYPKCCN